MLCYLVLKCGRFVECMFCCGRGGSNEDFDFVAYFWGAYKCWEGELTFSHFCVEIAALIFHMSFDGVKGSMTHC